MLSSIPTGAELLVMASIGGGGSVVYWFARKVMSIDKNVTHIMQKLYGDPNDRESDGLVAKHNRHGEEIVIVHQRVDGLEARVERVEGTCIAIHGDVIVRGQG
jgi:hypothetical protein